MVERNAGLPPERRIEFRVGIHLGDVVEESDGDLMGDGVNIAARLEGIAQPGGICLFDDAYRQVRDRIKEGFADLGEKDLKNIARPVRAYAVKTGSAGPTSATHAPTPDRAGPPRLSTVVLPFVNIGGDPEQEYFVDGVTESMTTDLSRIAGSFVIARGQPARPPGWSRRKRVPTPRSPGPPHEPTSPSVRSSRHRTTHAPTATTATRSAASFAFLKGLHAALVLGIATTAHRADETMFGQSSRFQPAAQLDHRRRVPLAARRARYLASV